MTLLPPKAPPLLLSPWALGFLPVNLGRTHTFRPWREAHLFSAVDATTCHEVSSLNNSGSRIPCGPVGREPSGQSLWAEIKVSARTALLSGGSWEGTHFLASSGHQLPSLHPECLERHSVHSTRFPRAPGGHRHSLAHGPSPPHTQPAGAGGGGKASEIATL